MLHSIAIYNNVFNSTRFINYTIDFFIVPAKKILRNICQWNTQTKTIIFQWKLLIHFANESHFGSRRKVSYIQCHHTSLFRTIIVSN